MGDRRDDFSSIAETPLLRPRRHQVSLWRLDAVGGVNTRKSRRRCRTAGRTGARAPTRKSQCVHVHVGRVRRWQGDWTTRRCVRS